MSISSLSKYRAAVDGQKNEPSNPDDKAQPRLPIRRGDGWQVDPLLLIEEEGFNPRGAFSNDYWNRPDVVAHIRGFADAYKDGRFVPPIVVVVRNGDILVRDGAHRRRGALLAIEEGAELALVQVTEFKGDEAAQATLVLTAADGRTLAPLERAVQYGKLVGWGWSIARIAKEAGKTTEHVRITLPLLDLPIELKQLIADDVIKATLAKALYDEHGTKALDLVKEAIAIQEAEQAQETTELELALKELTSGLETAQTPALDPAPAAAPDAEAGTGAKAQAPASQEPVTERKKIKITGKHVSKLTGVAPKISKKTAALVHKGFAQLGHTIDNITLQGDHFVMKLTADDVELLKEIKAQLAAAATPEPDEKDPAQAELLDQTETESHAGVTLQ
jgi:ParB-like chromosome segregation protein Spo0J